MVPLFAWHLAGPVFGGRQVFGDGIRFAGIWRIAGRLGSVAAGHGFLFCLQKVSFFDSLRQCFLEEKTMDDDVKLRALCGYALRDHVAYQDGSNSGAPSMVFADADYEIGDGKCGLHEDGKQANEPCIVYVRADALLHAQGEIERLEAAIEASVAAMDALLPAIFSPETFMLEDKVKAVEAVQAYRDKAAWRIKQEADAL
jgi:hypothetical protein